MRFSCADYTWPALSHPVVAAIIADLGFTGIDIGVFADDTHVKLSTVLSDATAAADNVMASIASSGLEVADVFLISGRTVEDLTPNHPDPAIRQESLQHFEATLRFALRLGAPGVTILPGVVFPDETVEQAIERAATQLRPRVERAHDVGLELSVEGHSGSCVDTPQRFATLLALTPGLKATLDPSHYAYAGYQAPDLDVLVANSRHVQVRPSGPDLMQGRLVDNSFDLRYLVGALRAAHYGGWLATEFVWMEKWACDRVDNTSETARLRHYLQELDEQ